MRLSVVTVAFLGLGAAVWAHASGPAVAPATASFRTPGAEAAMRAGLAARLSADLGGASDLALTALPAGGWAFRARVARPMPSLWSGAAPAAPAYGQAEALCDAGLDRPGCWRITLLEIEGAPAPGRLGGDRR